MIFLGGRTRETLKAATTAPLEPTKPGKTPNVHAFGSTVILCGQPDLDVLAEAKQWGIRVIINLPELKELD